MKQLNKPYYEQMQNNTKGEILNELALFAGAGGGILGGHLLGWRTICAVEWESYPASILIARQNDGILPPFPIWDDVQTFDGKPWRGRVDVVSGGFPCQDISCAGKGAGIDGERSSMWSHMARIIGEVRPKKVLVENSPMLVGRGLARVLGDLAEMGYDAEWGVMGAHNVAAPHKRDRIWIMAYSNLYEHRANGGKEREKEEISSKHREEGCSGWFSGTSGNTEILAHSDELTSEIGRDDNADAGEGRRGCIESGGSGIDDLRKFRAGEAGEMADSKELQCDFGDNHGEHIKPGKIPKPRNGCSKENEFSHWWEFEPDMGRVAHGVAARVDRLKAIGNGQVPAVAELAWQILDDKKD